VLQLTEDYEIAFHHDPEIIKRAVMYADQTGRLPTPEEIAENYPTTYLEDVALMRRMIHFQVSHLMGAE